MSIQKSENIIIEGDCPFCGTGYIFNDDDRTKGENLCTACGKSYKIDKSKNIILQNAPIVPNAVPNKKSSPLVPIIMIPIMILIVWFAVAKLPDILFPPDNSGLPATSAPLSPLDQCYSDAYDNMMENWVNYCEVNNINIYKNDKGKDTCNIPSSAEYIDRSDIDYLTAKALCLARYK